MGLGRWWRARPGSCCRTAAALFSLDPAHPNRLEPGKRTAHTLTAGMLLGEHGPELVYGTMGGEGQPQTSAAIVTRVVDHGLSVQEALDAPRWLLGRNWGEEHRGLRLEGRFGARWRTRSPPAVTRTSLSSRTSPT